MVDYINSLCNNICQLECDMKIFLIKSELKTSKHYEIREIYLEFHDFINDLGENLFILNDTEEEEDALIEVVNRFFMYIRHSLNGVPSYISGCDFYFPKTPNIRRYCKTFKDDKYFTDMLFYLEKLYKELEKLDDALINLSNFSH